MKHDEMTARTRQALAAALKDAMRRKPFSRISVSELIEATNINRKTFYYHFEDIYDLLRWMFEEEAISVVREFDTAIDYSEATDFIMEYIEQNDYIINCASDSLGREGLKRFFYQDFIGITTAVLKTAADQEGVELEPDYLAFLASFFTDAAAGMMLDYARDRQNADHAKLNDYMTRIIHAVIASEKQKQPLPGPQHEAVKP